jgi:hypothetical protein
MNPARLRLAALALALGLAYGAGAAVGAVVPDVHDERSPTAPDHDHSDDGHSDDGHSDGDGDR